MEHQISNKNHLESILKVLEKITQSQNELMRDNEIMRQKLQNYENLTNIIVSNANIAFLNPEINVIEYGQNYIALLEPYENTINPKQTIMEAVEASNMDANISSLARIFGIIYLPDNRKRDWNIQLLDKKQHKFSYVTSNGETCTDFSGKHIFNIFIFNFEQTLLNVINDQILKTLSDVENGQDQDSAYSVLIHTYNIRKYYSNFIRIKHYSEHFIKKLIQMYF